MALEVVARYQVLSEMTLQEDLPKMFQVVAVRLLRSADRAGAGHFTVDSPNGSGGGVRPDSRNSKISDMGGCGRAGSRRVIGGERGAAGIKETAGEEEQAS